MGRMVVPAALATPFLQTMCAKVQQRKQTTKQEIRPAVQRLSEGFGERRGYHTSGCCWEQLVIDQQMLHLALSSALEEAGSSRGRWDEEAIPAFCSW